MYTIRLYICPKLTHIQFVNSIGFRLGLGSRAWGLGFRWWKNKHTYIDIYASMCTHMCVYTQVPQPLPTFMKFSSGSLLSWYVQKEHLSPRRQRVSTQPRRTFFWAASGPGPWLGSPHSDSCHVHVFSLVNLVFGLVSFVFRFVPNKECTCTGAAYAFSTRMWTCVCVRGRGSTYQIISLFYRRTSTCARIPPFSNKLCPSFIYARSHLVVVINKVEQKNTSRQRHHHWWRHFPRQSPQFFPALWCAALPSSCQVQVFVEGSGFRV